MNLPVWRMPRSLLVKGHLLLFSGFLNYVYVRIPVSLYTYLIYYL